MNVNKFLKTLKKIRKSVIDSIDEKMTTSDINIHFKHYKNELKITIYLEYTNVMKFRKFKFNVIMLK
jgi:hypothetical protein